MGTTTVQHLLTEDERDRFARDGYLVFEGVLDAERIARLNEIADRYDADYRRQDGIKPFMPLNLHDLVGRESEFLDLVALPTMLPKVWGVMGWNIQLFHTQLVVAPKMPDQAPRGGYGWHQDNNRMNLDMETPLQPMVSVKIGYMLSDAPGPDMANFCLVPGSQLRGRPDVPLGEQPDGAIQMTGRAGDAVLFDRRIWHSASANHSETVRKMLFYGYSYRWLRPKSAMNFPDFLGVTDPVLRQLLGASPSGANGYYEPQPEDVPLREWIREHVGEDAVAP